MPQVSITPSGDNLVTAGTSFAFSCIVTFKIPPLPVEIVVNGDLDDGSSSRIIRNGAPDGFTSLLFHPYLFQNISTDDNDTSIQCRTFFVSLIGVIETTSPTSARLLVLGGLC